MFFIFMVEDDKKMVLSFTPTKAEAEEYICNRCCLDNKGHYDAWCELHNHDPKELATKRLYTTTIATNVKKYRYKQCTYDLNHIATIYRIGFGCYPLGCSFDSDLEYMVLMQKANKDVLDKVVSKLKKENKSKE